MQEKRAVIAPDLTPDVEKRLPHEKQAGKPDREQQTRQLDDDFTHRAADAVAAR